MKSSLSQGNSNCVEVVKSRDGLTVRVRDTKAKTGDVELVFDRAEWEAFTEGVRRFEFAWDEIETDVSDDRPMTSRERSALITRLGNSMARTPENLAYVNGRHAERAGWVPYTLAMFCRKFKHDPADPQVRGMFEAFQTGRRAEAHERSAES